MKWLVICSALLMVVGCGKSEEEKLAEFRQECVDKYTDDPMEILNDEACYQDKMVRKRIAAKMRDKFMGRSSTKEAKVDK